MVILQAAPTIAAAASSAEPWKGCFASGSSSGGAMALAFFEGACICRSGDRADGPRSGARTEVSPRDPRFDIAYALSLAMCKEKGPYSCTLSCRRTQREVAAPLLITRRVLVSHQGATVWCLACAQPSRRGSSATTSLRPLARMVFGRRGLLPEPWKSRSSL